MSKSWDSTTSDSSIDIPRGRKGGRSHGNPNVAMIMKQTGIVAIAGVVGYTLYLIVTGKDGFKFSGISFKEALFD